MNLLTANTRSFSIAVTLLVLACSSNDKKPTEAKMQAPSIVGSYQDEYGQSHRITDNAWFMGTSVFHIVSVDNPHSFLTAQNDAKNDSFPGKYSRFDWTYDDQDVLWYCQTAYDAESADKALQTPAASANDLATGCGGFPWSKLIPGNGDAGS